MQPVRAVPITVRPAAPRTPGPAGARPLRAGPAPDLLPPSWRRRLRPAVAVSVVWVLGWAAAVHGAQGPIGVERPLNDLLTSSRARLDGVATAFASINRPPVFAAVLAFMAVLCAAGRSARAGIVLVVALPATFAICEELKVVVARYGNYGTPTFPSGHVGVTSVLATVIVLLARRRGPLGRRLPVAVRAALLIAAGASVVAVAASMVILGAHFVTDTLAAAPIGLCVTWAVAAAADHLARRPAPGP